MNAPDSQAFFFEVIKDVRVVIEDGDFTELEALPWGTPQEPIPNVADVGGFGAPHRLDDIRLPDVAPKIELPNGIIQDQVLGHLNVQLHFRPPSARTSRYVPIP